MQSELLDGQFKDYLCEQEQGQDSISPLASTSSSQAEGQRTRKRKMEMSNVDIPFEGPGAALIARKKKQMGG